MNWKTLKTLMVTAGAIAATILLCFRFATGTSGQTSGNKAASDTRIVICATGGTDAYIETCGCAEGQFGGIARRGYQIALQRQVGSLDLVLDAGGFVHGTNRFERLVTDTHLKAIRRTGTYAVNVTGPEFNYGMEGLREFARVQPPRFVSTNLRMINAPWRCWRRF